ncbi:MAG TPA: hypothetical protein DD856_12315 [Sulfobacillus sp.]|nr:hypothetical protein [Sulfobacillus sp.]
MHSPSFPSGPVISRSVRIMPVGRHMVLLLRTFIIDLYAVWVLLYRIIALRSVRAKAPSSPGSQTAVDFSKTALTLSPPRLGSSSSHQPL